jgi:bifunctional non-homologous end joining protein LigD
VCYAFDLLWLDGGDLRTLPLINRKQRLRDLLQRSNCKEIIYAQHIETLGNAFIEQICQRDLEVSLRSVNSAPIRATAQAG